MARKIQFRRGIAATWTSTNPTLAIGEFGLETDTGRGKVGTGVTAWVSLPYLDAGAVAHIADTVAAHTAGAIAFTPAGTIAATDLQAAVVEVATDAAAATATVAGDLSTLSSATSDALALKAALASPALTGTPTAPTAVTATSTTQLATTAFVQQERAAQAATDSSRYLPTRAIWFAVEPEVASSGWGSFQAYDAAVSWFAAARSSNGNNTDYLEFIVQLRPGTYSVALFHLQQTGRGIYTLSINGTAHGTTVDGYNGGGNAKTRSVLTGVTVPGGDVTVRLSMLTKNASSSGYTANLNAVSFTRTGD